MCSSSSSILARLLCRGRPSGVCRRRGPVTTGTIWNGCGGTVLAAVGGRSAEPRSIRRSSASTWRGTPWWPPIRSNSRSAARGADALDVLLQHRDAGVEGVQPGQVVDRGDREVAPGAADGRQQAHRGAGDAGDDGGDVVRRGQRGHGPLGGLRSARSRGRRPAAPGRPRPSRPGTLHPQRHGRATGPGRRTAPRLVAVPQHVLGRLRVRRARVDADGVGDGARPATSTCTTGSYVRHPLQEALRAPAGYTVATTESGDQRDSSGADHLLLGPPDPARGGRRRRRARGRPARPRNDAAEHGMVESSTARPIASSRPRRRAAPGTGSPVAEVLGRLADPGGDLVADAGPAVQRRGRPWRR